MLLTGIAGLVIGTDAVFLFATPLEEGADFPINILDLSFLDLIDPFFLDPLEVIRVLTAYHQFTVDIRPHTAREERITIEFLQIEDLDVDQEQNAPAERGVLVPDQGELYVIAAGPAAALGDGTDGPSGRGLAADDLVEVGLHEMGIVQTEPHYIRVAV